VPTTETFMVRVWVRCSEVCERNARAKPAFVLQSWENTSPCLSHP
jgi:hypothetical protein